MKALIVEDDFTCRLLLQKLLAPFGECHVAVDGNEAMVAYAQSRADGRPYDLICLDIMMPGLDGHEVLRRIRENEDSTVGAVARARIVMTTALSDKENVFTAFREQCDGYLSKPIFRDKLIEMLVSLGLVYR